MARQQNLDLPLVYFVSSNTPIRYQISTNSQRHCTLWDKQPQGMFSKKR